MQKWIKKSAQLHKDFEIFQKAKKSQKLDLSDYIVSKQKEKQKNKLCSFQGLNLNNKLQ